MIRCRARGHATKASKVRSFRGRGSPGGRSPCGSCVARTTEGPAGFGPMSCRRPHPVATMLHASVMLSVCRRCIRGGGANGGVPRMMAMPRVLAPSREGRGPSGSRASFCLARPAPRSNLPRGCRSGQHAAGTEAPECSGAVIFDLTGVVSTITCYVIDNMASFERL